MKKIIFWFSNHKIRNYWFDYAICYCKKRINLDIQYNKLESWIQLKNLKISFDVNNRDYLDLIGKWDINQYWVEDLFDNNFECFFKEIIKENLNA